MLPDKIRDLYGVLHVYSPKAVILLRKAQHKVVITTENGPIYNVHANGAPLFAPEGFFCSAEAEQVRNTMFGEIE